MREEHAVDCERCRDAQVRLAQVRQSLSTALDAIQRCAEGSPSSCPHCGHCLHCQDPADVPCRHAAAGTAGPPAEDGAVPQTTSRALTPREQEVLVLLAGGMSNRHIARQLGIAEKTVKNHLGAIFAKLGVHARTQAALYAIKAGMHP